MPNHSTLKRPDNRLIQKFKIGQVGGGAVRTYLEKGFSPAICCSNCPKMTEWTPPELLERFRDNLDITIAVFAPRLKCTAPDGFGSDALPAVFPHLYDGPWSWKPSDKG